MIRPRAAFLAAAALAAVLGACASPVGLATPDDGRAQVQASVPSGYYDGLDGLTGEALLQALRRRIDGHTDLGYNAARDAMYADIDDPTDTDTVVSVYTGKVAKGVTDRRTADRQGFAAEHTWPQSLGAGFNAERADLHHLYPVDTSANSVRSNHPFGLVAHALKILPDESFAGQASKQGNDAIGTTVFEPADRHKGDVARSLMYFYVRYALPVNGKGPGPLSLRNFKVEKRVLQVWHRLDPVDANERRRNDRIYAIQGNRNPFVDRPEFVQRAGTAFIATNP